ncbi:MAG: hypothetical protein IPK26_25155 [Planctomycetes bacterium]|nr:hypothetical protein [Planctomycetota bacterium]
MIRLQDRVDSLSDLLDLRAQLRRQEMMVAAALGDVQGEIKSWHRHRKAQLLARQPMPRELCLLWEEPEGRERELALDLLQIRAALAEANAEITRKLERPATKVG